MQKKLLRICALAVLCSVYGHQYAAIVVTGDGATAGQTFSFPIAAHIYEKIRGFLFVAAQQAPASTAAGYAISFAGPDSAAFTPLVGAQQAVVNGTEQANPLYGAAINQLSLLDYNANYLYPVAVTSNEPGTVYLMQSGIVQNPKTFSLLSTGVLPDATGNPTLRIASLTTNFSVGTPNSGQTMPTGLQNGMAVFAAVTDSSGIFGAPGSGIATAVIQTNTTKKEIEFTLLPTVTLDVTSAVVGINAPLAAMQNFVTLSNYVAINPFFVPSRNNIFMLPDSRVYVGLQVQGGAAAQDGAYGVLTFGGVTTTFPETDNNRMLSVATPLLTPIVTSSAVTADSILAAIGPSAAVNIYAITNMKTSTLLPYLIVAGGVAPQGTRRTVFAMPQTSGGVLADVNSTPHLVYSQEYPGFLVGRWLNPAVAQGDLYSSTSVQAQVGAGPLPGDVSELITSGDTVFASIVTATTQNPGIFYSQALFDAQGLVKGWTAWQRAGNALTPTAGLALDEYSGNFWSLLSSNGNIFTIERTLWEKPQQGVQQFLQQQFSSVTGGIQGIFDFPATTPLFNQSQQLSVTIATGNNAVVIAQSGQAVNGVVSPVTNFSNTFTQTNGTLQGFTPGVTALTLSGGALSQIGAIITAEIITDGTYAWFAVAGANGLAILARPDGTGWLVSSGLQQGFVGLTADMQWMLCGQYHAVRKLVANQNALYILTQNTLQRAALSPAIIQQAAAFSSVVLAQGGNLPGGLNSFFSDLLVSKKVALLATSSGLLRVGDGADITTATNAQQMNWTPLHLQDSVGPITRLFGISATGRAEDLVQNAPLVSGNVYALNAYVGYSQAQVYRFTINYTGTITDTTIQQLPDIKLDGISTFFLSLGHYRNQMTTDGALFSVSRSKYLEDASFMELLSPLWVVGAPARSTGSMRIVDDPAAHSIGHMIRSSVTGSWLVPGEFGLFVNE